jgi:adenosylcobinamide-phosphate synthase
MSWLLIAVSAVFVPGCSPAKAFVIGYRHSGVLPSPNSGWPEAATAGAIRRRLVGPIWKEGQMVTDIWIGDPNDPPVSTRADLIRAIAVAILAGLMAVGLALAAIVFLIV